jgi:hypothetical protein
MNGWRMNVNRRDRKGKPAADRLRFLDFDSTSRGIAVAAAAAARVIIHARRGCYFQHACHLMESHFRFGAVTYNCFRLLCTCNSHASRETLFIASCDSVADAIGRNVPFASLTGLKLSIRRHKERERERERENPVKRVIRKNISAIFLSCIVLRDIPNCWEKSARKSRNAAARGKKGMEEELNTHRIYILNIQNNM